jgi:hypothetical protein
MQGGREQASVPEATAGSVSGRSLPSVSYLLPPAAYIICTIGCVTIKVSCL